MKKIALFFALCAYIFVGCGGNEPEDVPIGPEIPVKQEHQVTILFTTQTTTRALLKSDASTAEDLISKVIIFGVDDNNTIIEKYPTVNNPSLTGTTLTVNIRVKSLYAIANPSAAIEALTPATVTDLTGMVGNFASTPKSPFLMSGKGSVIGNNVTVELIRAIAKVGITGKNDFQISTVTVMNTPNEGYVFKKETFSIPGSTTRVSYPVLNSSTPMLYVAENNRQNPTQFVVTGQLYGKNASYTIVLKSEGQDIDIVRNTFYQVDITPITESECAVSVTIPGWNDVGTDDHVIPDDNFES